MHLYYYRDLKINAFISQHRDGELLARTLVRFGYEVVRGSSTRGGFEGMRGLLRALKRGHDVALAPDGPRGPAQIVSPGVIAMARLSGCPIRPVAYGAKWVFRAKSWDRFMVPLPFSMGAVEWGPPIYVPREANAVLSEEKRMELQRELNKISHKVDRAVGRQGPI